MTQNNGVPELKKAVMSLFQRQLVMHCSASVRRVLTQLTTQEEWDVFLPPGCTLSYTALDLYVDPDLPPGAWKVFEDNKLVKEGVING